MNNNCFAIFSNSILLMYVKISIVPAEMFTWGREGASGHPTTCKLAMGKLLLHLILFVTVF